MNAVFQAILCIVEDKLQELKSQASGGQFTMPSLTSHVADLLLQQSIKALKKISRYQLVWLFFLPLLYFLKSTVCYSFPILLVWLFFLPLFARCVLPKLPTIDNIFIAMTLLSLQPDESKGYLEFHR